MLDLDTEVILFNETNNDWKNYDLKVEYNNHIKKHWPTNPTQFSTSKAKADKEYLPGDTSTTILGKWVSRILQSTEDSSNMGHWSAVQLQGKQQGKILFISAYRVSQNTLPGSQTAYT